MPACRQLKAADLQGDSAPSLGDPETLGKFSGPAREGGTEFPGAGTRDAGRELEAWPQRERTEAGGSGAAHAWNSCGAR